MNDVTEVKTEKPRVIFHFDELKLLSFFWFEVVKLVWVDTLTFNTFLSLKIIRLGLLIRE